MRAGKIRAASTRDHTCIPTCTTVHSRPLLKIQKIIIFNLYSFCFFFFFFFSLLNIATSGIYASACIQPYLVIVGGVLPAWDLECWVCQSMSQFATILRTERVCILILLKSLDLNPQ